MKHGSGIGRREFLATAGGGALSLGLAGCFLFDDGGAQPDAAAADTGGLPDATADLLPDSLMEEQPDDTPRDAEGKKPSKFNIPKMPRHVRHRRAARDRELDGWPAAPAAHPTDADCERLCFGSLFAHMHDHGDTQGA